jgi:hypothetical protein
VASNPRIKACFADVFPVPPSPSARFIGSANSRPLRLERRIAVRFVLDGAQQSILTPLPQQHGAVAALTQAR